MSAASPNTQIENIIQKLKTASNPANPDEITRQRRILARLTKTALQDDAHPIHEQLNCLRDYVQGRDLTNAAFFTPSPGSSHLDKAKLWPLQLLLYNAAINPKTRDEVTDTLNIRENELEQALELAAKTVEDWNAMLLVDRLTRAAEDLRWPPAERPFRLDGKKFIYEGHEPVILSGQQSALLKMLIDNIGQPVTHDTLKKAGMTAPSDRLHDLKQKLDDAGLPALKITTGTRSVTLSI